MICSVVLYGSEVTRTSCKRLSRANRPLYIQPKDDNVALPVCKGGHWKCLASRLASVQHLDLVQLDDGATSNGMCCWAVQLVIRFCPCQQSVCSTHECRAGMVLHMYHFSKAAAVVVHSSLHRCVERIHRRDGHRCQYSNKSPSQDPHLQCCVTADWSSVKAFPKASHIHMCSIL